MVEEIKNFANMRIIRAEVISQIKPNDVVVTYGSNHTIKRVLLTSIENGINFSLIIVSQNKEDIESFELAEVLSNTGIDLVFCQLNSLPLVGRKISKVLFGGTSMMNNGYLLSKAGTASIACWAKSKMVPVIVCIESFKFSTKAVVHSLVTSEIKDGEDGVKSKLNNKYDITPSKFIDMVV